jgi:CBS domain containing-hemolysin-like protein
MADPSRSPDSAASIWRGLRSLIAGRPSEPTLREEIAEAIEDHARDPASADDLSATERQMLSNLLALSEKRVEDAAVPRADIIAFDLDDDFDALVRAFAEAGHSRLPAFRDSLDQPVGMIHVKDVYALLARDERAAPETLVRPVLYVPEAMRVLDLLARMRANRTHMAIVIDEFGGAEGLVTIEDLVEEIVGDIEDEHDEHEEAMLQALAEGGWEADARLELSDLEAALGAELAASSVVEDVDTLGGMIVALAGRVPGVGETVEHPAGWRFTVTDGDTRRIVRARIAAPVAAPAALPAQSAAR